MVVRKMKEKCKDAARMRREKERAEFVELSRLLPLPSSTTSQLDKASIIRLTSSYLRMRSAFPEGLGKHWGTDAKCIAKHRDLLNLQQYSLPNQMQMPQPHNMYHHNPQQMQQIKELGSLILQTLDGFVFALHSDGKIMYISETASVHLGLPQIDLTGSSVFEYVHPADHNDIYDILGLSEADKLQIESKVHSSDVPLDSFELGRSFCMRMKCILPKRNAGLVNSGYKAIHCNGYLKVRCKKNLQLETLSPNELLSCIGSSSINGMNKNLNTNASQDYETWEGYALVAVGHSLLPTASTEVKLSESSFMFRANLDLKLYYIEAPVMKLLGFEQVEMIGQSLYQFIHVNDAASIESSHKTLLTKGQVVTKYYRLMKKDGGFIWVQSYATLVNNPRSMPKPQHIVGVCFVLGNEYFDRSCAIQQQASPYEQRKSFTVSSTNTETIAPASSPKLPNSLHKLQPRKDKHVVMKRTRKFKINSKDAELCRRNTIKSSDKSLLDSHQCSQSQKQCVCAPSTSLIIANPVDPIEYTTLGSTRRTSEDSCSVVSSVASTSISNSSHNQVTDFSSYTSSDGYEVDQHIVHPTYPVESPTIISCMNEPQVANNNQSYDEFMITQPPGHVTKDAVILNVESVVDNQVAQGVQQQTFWMPSTKNMAHPVQQVNSNSTTNFSLQTTNVGSNTSFPSQNDWSATSDYAGITHNQSGLCYQTSPDYQSGFSEIQAISTPYQDSPIYLEKTGGFYYQQATPMGDRYTMSSI